MAASNVPRAFAVAVSALAILCTSAALSSFARGGEALPAFISPGSDLQLEQLTLYPNERGALAVLYAKGPVRTRGNPFFEPASPGARACVTCHQPSDAMSVSVRTVQARWKQTAGADPLFAAVDGSNCPDLPQQLEASHSLLLKKGLFRVGLPWPPRDEYGKPVAAEFSLEVVSDPTGCAASTVYGLAAKEAKVNVYRRPRPVVNLKYVESTKPLGLWQVRSGEVLPLDPLTGHRLAGNLMADSRMPTLRFQMADAMATHMSMKNVPGANVIDQIREFELQIFAAQVSDKVGGSLQEGGAKGGPEALRDGRIGVLGAFPHEPSFPEFDGWRTQRTLAAITWQPIMAQPARPPRRPGEETETAIQSKYRDSVARGYDLFMYRQFLIRDVGSLNPLLGNPVKQTCANCHNMQRTGLDNAPGFLGLGTNNYPTATPAPDLPLYKITCRKDAPPHPYLGRVIYAHDPGRALVSGKCADVAATTAQQMRALSARAPYFAGGSAATLRDVVEFYDRRFSMGYSEQDTEDMVNFLGAL